MIKRAAASARSASIWTTTGLIQTIPSLAILAFASPLAGARGQKARPGRGFLSL